MTVVVTNRPMLTMYGANDKARSAGLIHSEPVSLRACARGETDYTLTLSEVPGRQPHCGLIFAVFTVCCHFFISSAMNFWNSAGESAMGTAPSS